jgi:hypothetical protein
MRRGRRCVADQPPRRITLGRWFIHHKLLVHLDYILHNYTRIIRVSLFNDAVNILAFLKWSMDQQIVKDMEGNDLA